MISGNVEILKCIAAQGPRQSLFSVNQYSFRYSDFTFLVLCTFQHTPKGFYSAQLNLATSMFVLAYVEVTCSVE